MIGRIRAAFNDVSCYISLFFAEFYLRRGQPEKVRRHVDRIIGRDPPGFEFIVPYDAYLMVFEKRHQEALYRFQEGLKLFQSDTSDDGRFITAYCCFWISVMTGAGRHWQYFNSSRGLNPEPMLRQLFSYPTEEKLRKIYPMVACSPMTDRSEFSAHAWTNYDSFHR